MSRCTDTNGPSRKAKAYAAGLKAETQNNVSKLQLLKFKPILFVKNTYSSESDFITGQT